jgi:hypothetical protein
MKYGYDTAKVNDGNFQATFRRYRKNKESFSILFTNDYKDPIACPRSFYVNRVLEHYRNNTPSDVMTLEALNLIYVDSFEAPKIFNSGFGVTTVPVLIVYRWDEKSQEYYTSREELPSRIVEILCP